MGYIGLLVWESRGNAHPQRDRHSHNDRCSNGPRRRWQSCKTVLLTTVILRGRHLRVQLTAAWIVTSFGHGALHHTRHRARVTPIALRMRCLRAHAQLSTHDPKDRKQDQTPRDASFHRRPIRALRTVQTNAHLLLGCTTRRRASHPKNYCTGPQRGMTRRSNSSTSGVR